MLDQSNLNKEMAEIGIGRFNSQWESAKDGDDLSRSRVGQRLFRELLPEYTNRVKELYRNHKGPKTRWQEDIGMLQPSQVAFIGLKTILNSLSYKKTCASLSYLCGKMVENEIKCVFLVRTNPEKGKGIILGAKRRAKASQMRHIDLSMQNENIKEGKDLFNKWSRRDRFSLGLNLVELLRVSTGLIEYAYIKEKGRKRATRYVTATPATLKWIEEYNTKHSLLDPFWLPTVEPPTDWVNLWTGGYSHMETNLLPEAPFIKIKDNNFLRSLKPKDLSIPFEAVNLIQRTPWQINNRVLDIVEWCWDNSIPVSGIAERADIPIPPYPIDGDTNKKSRSDWARTASGIHKRNLSTRSKRVLCARIIQLAKKYKDNRFFLPSNCDFRGRVYMMPSFINPQGPPLCKGLLEFNREARIKKVEDARWLAIHGANCYGNDKLSLKERESWAYNFGDDAVRIAADPKTNTDWMEADDPFPFLAWVFKWSEYYQNFLKGTPRLKTRLPVMMDATNNGLQILSMLMRCPVGCKSTNVIYDGGDKPADIYVEAQKIAESYLKADAKDNHRFARLWLDYGINRGCLKRPVMCKPYGLSRYSNRQYVADWFDDKIHGESQPSPFKPEDYYKAVHYLSEIVWKSIEDLLDLPKKCMKWFQDVAKVVSEAGRYIHWVSPSGFPVKQDYKKLKGSEVRTWISGKVVSVCFNENLDKISPQKMSNGVAPNTVHSLDSTLLHLTTVAACKEKGIYDFSMIHDSYGTHSTKAQDLADTIRDEAVKMFNKDLLKDWLDQLKKQHPDLDFPALPEYGDADISLIRDSPYFFS